MMFEELRKKLFFSKMQLLFREGFLTGKIVQFDESIYNKLDNTYFNCIPISFHIKYLRPILPPGKCYDRSLLMFFCFDDALLVRGDNKSLELRYGKEHAGHGWIEMGDYVYDPSIMMRFDKDLYYKIYCPTNIKKTNVEEYKKLNGEYYDNVRATKIDDFQIGGSKRSDLCVTIPLVKGIAECSEDKNFQKDLEDYLNLISYDEQQVYDEMKSSFERCLRK